MPSPPHRRHRSLESATSGGSPGAPRLAPPVPRERTRSRAPAHTSRRSGRGRRPAGARHLRGWRREVDHRQVTCRCFLFSRRGASAGQCRIDRERSRTGQGEGSRRGAEHEENSTPFGTKKPPARCTRKIAPSMSIASPSPTRRVKQSGDECDATEELESRDERGRDRRQRGPDPGKRTGDAREPVLEKLLGSMGQEDRAVTTRRMARPASSRESVRAMSVLSIEGRPARDRVSPSTCCTPGFQRTGDHGLYSGNPPPPSSASGDPVDDRTQSRASPQSRCRPHAWPGNWRTSVTCA